MAIPTKKPNPMNNDPQRGNQQQVRQNSQTTSENNHRDKQAIRQPKQPENKPAKRIPTPQKENISSNASSQQRKPAQRKPAQQKKETFSRDPYNERAVFVEDENSTEFTEQAKKQFSKDDDKKQKNTPTEFKEIDVSTISVSVDEDSLINPEYHKDPVTGKVYQRIPKTKMDSNGMPMIQTDINDLDLEGAAERFLAHLRVPPSKEEIEKLKQERIRKAQEAREKQKKPRNTQEELRRLYDGDK